MDHKTFVMRLVEFISKSQGTILINEYEVNGARHCKSEVNAVNGTVEVAITLGAMESVVEFVSSEPGYREYFRGVHGNSIIRIEANRDFVRIRTNRGETVLVNYREWNYTDEGGFGSTMPWETEEEFKSRCDKINAGLGLVTA